MTEGSSGVIGSVGSPLELEDRCLGDYRKSRGSISEWRYGGRVREVPFPYDKSDQGPRGSTIEEVVERSWIG